MAEEKLGSSVSYVTYTAEEYQDKTYDDVALLNGAAVDEWYGRV